MEASDARSPSMKLRYAEAFARYGAKLRNKTWSWCAVAPDNSLVISLWAGKFKRGGKYVDNLSRVSGYRVLPGYVELGEKLQTALVTEQPIRAVIAHSDEPGLVDSGASTGTCAKYFTTSDLIGTVTHFDGDELVIEFRQDRRVKSPETLRRIPVT